MSALRLLRRTPALMVAGALSFGVFNHEKSNFALMASNEPMSKKEWRDYNVGYCKDLTHNTKRIRIELPLASNTPVASVVMIKTTGEDGKEIVRPYTPINSAEGAETDHIELVVKSYPAPGGVMSRYLHSLEPGDTVSVKGPFVKIPYTANKWREIGMVAGGTGITPMVQVAREVLNNPEDRTNISLVFANVSQDDILLRDELIQLERAFPGRMRIYYVVDKASPYGDWVGGVGYVTKEMLANHLPPASLGADVCVMVCGPDPMVKMLAGPKNKDRSQGPLMGYLKELGFTEENVFKF